MVYLALQLNGIKFEQVTPEGFFREREIGRDVEQNASIEVIDGSIDCGVMVDY